MADEKTDQNDGDRPFDMSPTHPIWTQMERGIQILLGFSLVTAIHFLGESWGQSNVPYDKLFPAIGAVGLAFIYSLLITPIAGYMGMALRAFTPLPGYRINQIRVALFNVVLLVLLLVFFREASIFISALVEAVGLDPNLPETWNQKP